MFRITGAIMILCSGTIIGFSKSRALKTRKESLEKILYSLRIMENEICYGKSNMERVFEKITGLGGIVLEKDETKTAGECFLMAINCEKLKLEKEDTEVLMRFSESLGITDSVAQLKNIKNTSKSLEILTEKAGENLERYGKMYKSMGFLISALAVIILI